MQILVLSFFILFIVHSQGYLLNSRCIKFYSTLSLSPDLYDYDNFEGWRRTEKSGMSQQGRFAAPSEMAVFTTPFDSKSKKVGEGTKCAKSAAEATQIDLFSESDESGLGY